MMNTVEVYRTVNIVAKAESWLFRGSVAEIMDQRAEVIDLTIRSTVFNGMIFPSCDANKIRLAAAHYINNLNL